MRIETGGPLPFAVLFIAALFLLVPLAQIPHPATRVALAAASGGESLTWSDPYRIVQHRIPGNNSDPWALTADSQGRVWFVEQGTNQLGMYDPSSGSFRQYAIPSPRSTPGSVASDSQGNVWFTGLTSNKLAELQAGASRIVEYSVPPLRLSVAGMAETIDCGPEVVLPDPSGPVWVACIFSGQIDEFFPANGTFAHFDLPVFNSAPAGMVLDGRGDIWFTAADAQMLGKAVVAELRNGTSEGITEFPPLNQTYPFKFTLPTSFLNTTKVVTSSLPTPSGIAMDPSGRLWVTEHVDSSFDSYDPATASLVKYWTSQTYGAFGFPVSFPNGVAVDKNGDVWVGEHYGNKVAELQPSSGMMTEHPVPCCASTIAGVYSVALDRNGSLWFVEINGNAIGEVVRTRAPYVLSLSVPQTSADLGDHGSLTLPLAFSQPPGEANSTRLALSISGVSATGAVQNMTATFSPATVDVVSGTAAGSNLTLALAGLNPGVYYLTMTAAASPLGQLYSVILKLTVTGGPSTLVGLVLPATLGLTAAALLVAWVLSRRFHTRSGRGRFLPLRYSLRSARSTATAVAATAT